jgi:hypothetical protein
MAAPARGRGRNAVGNGLLCKSPDGTERALRRGVLPADHVSRTAHKESVVRAFRILATASGFLTYFLGLVFLSAVTTSAVHSAFSPRPVMVGVLN